MYILVYLEETGKVWLAKCDWLFCKEKKEQKWTDNSQSNVY